MTRSYQRWTPEEDLLVRAVLEKEPRVDAATRMARDALMSHDLGIRSLASVASRIQKLKAIDAR